MCSAQLYLQSSYRKGKESDAGVIFSFFLSVFMSSRLYLCLLSKPASETFGSAKHFNTVNHSESVPRSLCLTRCSFSFRQSSYSGHSFTLVWLLFFSPGHWNKARPTLQQPWNFFFFFTRLAVVQGIVEIPQLMEQELALLFNFTHLSFDNNRTKVACISVFSQFFCAQRKKGSPDIPLVGVREYTGVMQRWGHSVKFHPHGRLWIIRTE